MNLPPIQSTADVTEGNLAEMTAVAENLATQSDEVIQTVVNSSILLPRVQQQLQAGTAQQFLSDELVQNDAPDGVEAFSEDDDYGILSFPQEDQLGGFWSTIKGLFSGLRKKVRRIFCTVVNGFGQDSDLNLKGIIKDVLLVLIPAFAASSGLLPIALPIVVSLAALLIKHGVAKVCPA